MLKQSQCSRLVAYTRHTNIHREFINMIFCLPPVDSIFFCTHSTTLNSYPIVCLIECECVNNKSEKTTTKKILFYCVLAHFFIIFIRLMYYHHDTYSHISQLFPHIHTCAFVFKRNWTDISPI